MLEIYIKKYREEAGWTIEKLSWESGVSKSHISAIESGKSEPTISILCKIANALGIEERELYSFTPIMARR